MWNILLTGNRVISAIWSGRESNLCGETAEPIFLIMRLNLPDRAAVCVSGVQKNMRTRSRVVYEFGCADTGIGMSETFLEHAFEPFTPGE